MSNSQGGSAIKCTSHYLPRRKVPDCFRIAVGGGPFCALVRKELKECAQQVLLFFGGGVRCICRVTPQLRGIHIAPHPTQLKQAFHCEIIASTGTV